MSAETYAAVQQAMAEHFADEMNADAEIPGTSAFMTNFVAMAVGVNTIDRYALHLRVHSDMPQWQLLGLATLLQAQMQNNALFPDAETRGDE